MSTYETTAGLGDERVSILPRRGLVKNHYYTRATHGIVEVMWSNRGAFVEKGFFSGSPKISDFWGEQRPWSPADLVERYRLCDSSAECDQALLSLKNVIR